jgi:hypothetical protein
MLFRNHALVAAMAVLCTMFCALPAHAEDRDRPPVRSQQAYDAAAGNPPVFTVTPENHHDTLPSLIGAVVPDNSNVKRTHFEGMVPLPPGSLNQPDGAVQKTTAPTFKAPAVSLNFDGVGAGFTGPNGTFSVTSAPPDTDGAVGSTQYVSLVNTDLAVFNKTTGAVMYGPVPTNTLWSGFGGGCQTNNDGDGVVIYDRAAGRWVVSQFSVSTTPYLQCVAVSQTSDATGGWNRYSFSYGNTNFPDYPKMGSWPDAYYTTFNVFANGSTFSGANLCAYDRSKMLTGAAATQQCFQLSSAYGGVLPSDLDGATAPPANSPNYLIAYDTNSLDLWKFHVDWTTPANSTLNGPTNISVPSFSPVCGGGTCITQPGTTNTLDSLADRMMFRLAYRNFGDHEALVASHSVVAGTKGGVRWYELRNPGGTPTVYQASTFAPDTTAYRWMPSIAMDQAGDIALGYSVSTKTAPTINPSVVYTGRASTDTLNTMQTEVNVITGGGVQNGGLSRWGDYSAMTVDPVDDCTFWFTSEYIPSNGSFNWKTRIASFKFPGCGKQNQTITFPNPGPLTYSPSGTFTLTATASSGLTVTYTSTTTGVCTVSGSTATIVAAGTCTINADQAGNASYNAAPTMTDNITINKANQTIAFTSTAPAGAVVGGATYAVTATGGVSGNAVTFTIDAASSGVCTIAGSTVSFTGVGTCTIDANQAGNANYNAATQAQQSFAVGKGSQTITFPNPGAQTYSSGGTFAVSATATSGLAVTFTSTTPSVCSVAGSTVTILSGGTCTIAANQAGDSNYNAAPTVSDNITINPASQTISFPNPGAQTYSPSGSFGVSATATSGLTVTFTSTTPGACTVAGSTVTIVAAGTCSINADQSGNANYNAAPTVSDNITINQASQTITFTSTPPGGATVGGPTYTVTASGGASGNAVTFTIDGSSSGVCTIAGSTVSFIGTDSCLIDANQAGNTNYAAAAQAQQAVSVGVASQTITFPNPGPVTYSPSGTFALTATGGASGNPVTYASNSTGVCTVAGSTVTIVSAGICSITASQAGNTNYGAATPVTDLVTINPAGQTITFTTTPPASPAYGGSYAVSASGGASGNPVTFSIDGSSTAGACSVAGNSVSFTGTGSCVVDANQAGNTNYTAATQQQQGFTIGAANQTISFTSTAPAPAVLGQPAYTVMATASSTLPVTLSIDAGSASVCTLSGSASGSTVSFIGLGTCTIDADQAGDANYNPASQAQQSFTVDIGAVSLVFTTQPADVAQGGTQGTLAVTEQNQYGYVVSSDSSSAVDFTVSSCGGTFQGSATMTNGVATLSNSALRFYTVNPNPLPTISASSTGTFTGNVTSNTFNVTANGGMVFSDGFESCRP